MKHILLILSFVVLSQNAHALGFFLIEPYAGYNFGNNLVKFTDGTKEDTDIKGATFGARLGLDLPFVFLALDGSVATGSGNVSNSSADYDYYQSTFGATVGISIPFAATRIWAGYSPFNLLKFTNNTNNSTDSMRGTQMKAGIGFRIIPYLHINCEYKIDDFDEYNGKAFSANAVKSIDSHSVLISLSVPI